MSDTGTDEHGPYHIPRYACTVHVRRSVKIKRVHVVAPEPLGTGTRALPLLELAGHGGAQIEQEKLPGWAPSMCHKMLHCILQVYADMHLTHFTLLEVYLLN